MPEAVNRLQFPLRRMREAILLSPLVSTGKFLAWFRLSKHISSVLPGEESRDDSTSQRNDVNAVDGARNDESKLLRVLYVVGL